MTSKSDNTKKILSRAVHYIGEAIQKAPKEFSYEALLYGMYANSWMLRGLLAAESEKNENEEIVDASEVAEKIEDLVEKYPVGKPVEKFWLERKRDDRQWRIDNK
jgi:hypothetical protein